VRKTVLCYGDSNTWGVDEVTGGRLPRVRRWPGILAADVADEAEVIEAGLPGRTTVFDDPVLENRNGRTQFLPVLESHAPIDLVVIMLGTNDLKARFALRASDIAEGVGALVRMARRSACGPDGGAPEVLLLAPPPIDPTGPHADLFAGGAEKSRQLAGYFEYQARRCGCGFLDTGTVTGVGNPDGFHLDSDDHAALGKALVPVIRQALG
jgi:lysophospholipase L1-like esterase